jgi:hypothetical protein
MVEPDFNLGNHIKLIPGKKSTDKQMIEFNGRIIYPSEISKVVLLFLLLEDDKWKKPRFEGGDKFQNYLISIMTNRKYHDPPSGALKFKPYQGKLD